jgi:glycosyltransferase involved in cell wall biosynthesis
MTLEPKEMNEIRYSVVIPTWNEEGWIAGLLENLKSFKEVDDIIVVDNYSLDQTRDIAKAHGACVVEGGRPGSARNHGVSLTHRDFVLLVDADAAIPNGALDRITETFSSRQQVAAIHFRLTPIEASPFVRFCYHVMDYYLATLDHVGISQGVGTFVAVRKSSFNAVGGFREELTAGEDADFMRRIRGVGVVKYIRSVTIGTSSRRFRIENPFIFAVKTIIWGLLRLLGLNFSIRGYSWKRYPRELSQADRPKYVEFLKRRDQDGRLQ